MRGREGGLYYGFGVGELGLGIGMSLSGCRGGTHELVGWIDEEEEKKIKNKKKCGGVRGRASDVMSSE